MSSINDGKLLIRNTIESLIRCVEMMDGRRMIANKTPMNIPSSNSASNKEKLNEFEQMTNHLQQTTLTVDNSNSIKIEAFRDETQMADIMRVITNDLSEPYSIYTYRYFIHKWPHLCLLARDLTRNAHVGVVVCKVDEEPYCCGYIAMLAVDASCRRKGIGSQLVREAIKSMRSLGCVDISLETEVTNEKALNLYSGLGFIREKRLYRYYLNGVDAFRLKLAICPPPSNQVGAEVFVETPNSVAA